MVDGWYTMSSQDRMQRAGYGLDRLWEELLQLVYGRRKFVRPDAAVYNKKDAQQRRLFEKNKG